MECAEDPVIAGYDVPSRLHDRATAGLALDISREQFELLAANIPYVFWIADARDGRLTYVSPAYAALFGRAVDTVCTWAFDWTDAVHPLDRDRVRAAYYGSTASLAAFDEECRIVRPDGSIRSVHARTFIAAQRVGTPTHVTGTIIDITERRNLESTLNTIVHFDHLTGLPNRLLFQDRLAQVLSRARHAASVAAVMVVDIDHFNVINETLGHAAADALLEAVALRLARIVGPRQTVARLGADEFALAIADLAATEDVVPVAQQIMAAFEQPFGVEGNEVFLNISIGIAAFPADCSDADDLLRNADIAMHRAKELGRSRFQLYSSAMNARSGERLALRKHLRRALEHGEFSLEYQPKAELVNGAITGFEALLRWHNPELGETPPNVFVPILEETGQIVAVGEWILVSACQQIRRWMERGITPVPIAVNLSASQLLQSDVDVRVAAILEQHGVDARFLELEVTESVLMQHHERVAIVLRNLKHMGIRLAIDDFGTGYSSLSYLRSFPLDTLKIDRSFVRDVINSGETALITQAVIAMAVKLRLRVVAEGVENHAQLAFLAACGCDEVQGFYFSPAVTAMECTQMLIDRRKLELPQGEDTGTERTLLLVDDDPRILSALRRVLRADGYTILTAGSAAEGLELLASNRIGVVVTDQRMPGMTGVDFLRRAKETFPGTVRIMLSGYADFQSITDAINQGAVYKFLTKPWDDKLLRETMVEAFRRHAEDASNHAVPAVTVMSPSPAVRTTNGAAGHTDA